MPPCAMPSVPTMSVNWRHEPAFAKHPAARLMPPVVENVEVAVEKLMPLVLPTESKEPGVVVPMPTLPATVDPVPVIPVPKMMLPMLSCPSRVEDAILICFPMRMLLLPVVGPLLL